MRQKHFAKPSGFAKHIPSIKNVCLFAIFKCLISLMGKSKVSPLLSMLKRKKEQFAHPFALNKLFF